MKRIIRKVVASVTIGVLMLLTALAGTGMGRMITKTEFPNGVIIIQDSQYGQTIVQPLTGDDVIIHTPDDAPTYVFPKSTGTYSGD